MIAKMGRWIVVALALEVGCVDAPVASPDLQRRAAAPVAAPPAPAATPPAPPAFAEVEMSGRVDIPAGTRGEVRVFATDGECWQPSSRAYGSASVVDLKEGYFFLEVFVPQGASIWLCAAAVAGPRPPTLYGARAPVRGEGMGEVIYKELHITLARGKPVPLPLPRPKR